MTLMAFLASSLSQAQGRVIISEFLAVNDKGLVNANGDRSDWIEIHNAGDATIDLAGWTLTDDAADLAKWTFPAVKIEAGGYLLVFASGADRARPDRVLHANFKLGASGEYLGLVKPGGRTVAHHFVMKYPRQRDDVSYGIPAGWQPNTASAASVTSIGSNSCAASPSNSTVTSCAEHGMASPSEVSKTRQSVCS